MTSFLAEIRRRKVFRVAGAYLVVAWLIIQIADTVAPQLNLPDWAPRLITFALFLGFPLALVLAWAFDITPLGVRTDKKGAGGIGLYLIAAAIAIAATGWYLNDGKPAVPVSDGSASIAVLPFVNMSGDPDNEYFSDGITEEILNVLAQLPSLKVASRTSSFAFKNQAREIPDIARELHVDLVLEGSVRRQGNEVRITAQLIDAASGFHLWSETYDRNLKDIFTTQDEIATAIVEALELKLGAGDIADRSRQQTDPDVYDKYLRARAMFPSRRPDDLKRAASMLEEVIAADPNLATAYADLAMIYAVLPFYSTEPRVETHEKARRAALYALALSPGLAEAFGALGDVAIHDQRYDLAEVLLERAVSEAPSMVAAHYWLAEKHLYSGEFDLALGELDTAMELDQHSRTGGYLRAMTLYVTGKPAEARKACETVLGDAPEHDTCRAILVLIALHDGDAATLRRLLLDRPSLKDEKTVQMATSIADAVAGIGDRDAVATLLLNMPHHALYDPDATGVVHDMVIPALLVALDRNDLAIMRLQALVEQDPDEMMQIIWTPNLDAVRCEPEFQALIPRLRIVDSRAARLCQVPVSPQTP